MYSTCTTFWYVLFIVQATEWSIVVKNGEEMDERMDQGGSSAVGRDPGQKRGRMEGNSPDIRAEKVRQ